MKATVAFLARGVDGGLASVRDFLAGYAAHPAGASHRLVLLAKGWDGVASRDEMLRLAATIEAEVVDLPDDGLDIGAYFRFAPLLDTEFVYLLNTHSRIRGDGWLALPLAAAARPGVGAVGATGSWGTFGASWRLQMAMCRTCLDDGRVAAAALRAVTAPLRWLRRWIATRREFPGFPNPHLRFNAILIRTTLFQRFAAASRMPVTKGDTHALESGRAGLTRFIEREGMAVLVCGSDGVPRASSDWIAAETMATPGQRGLLVADNHTCRYAGGDVFARRDFETLAWGRPLTPPDPTA